MQEEKKTSEKNQSIFEFDFNLICEYFASLKRQGPGSPEATLKALSFIENLPPNAQIIDLGCGTGGQTMTLAQHVTGNITGLDLFPIFIDIFNNNASTLHLNDRVHGVVGSMDQLPFDHDSLDLIWSEGAIYNIGFKRGIQEWKSYLKTGGYIAVTDATWFTSERPKAIDDFWMEHYPEMDTIPNKVAQLQEAGYVPVASFILPENCWTEHFYAPQKEAQEAFLKKHAGNRDAVNYIEFERYEKRMYDTYKAFYGYVFYIGRKL